MRKKPFDLPPTERGRKKRKSGEIRWEQLDNTAHIFPVIAGERLSNVFRVSVTLEEPVDPEKLQQALDLVLPKFDGFNVRLRKGVFWHYFEENGKPAPRVQEEKTFPCRYIRANRNKSYLFRVTYYRYRINLEVFHVLTDGMGALNFLKELTYQYLRLVHEELMEDGDRLCGGTSLNREDSFLRNYRCRAKKTYRTQRALLVKGRKLNAGELGVMHGYLSVEQLKAVCARYGVSINEYLVAVFTWSVYTEYCSAAPQERPIRVAVPVNLRPYFASNTTKNFFVMISSEFLPDREGVTFEEVLETVRESLRRQMNREHLEQTFSYNVSNQKALLLRLVPLPLKGPAMRLVYNRAALANTTTITNVGSIEVEEPYRSYIDRFHAFIGISKGQHLRGTVCSYNGTLVFTFSYDLADRAIQRGFFRRLAQDGLRVEIESNEVNDG